IDRIRFTTSHPNEFSSTLIEAYANVPQLADHLHLPVQSGSDRILNKMGRAHTVLEYKSKIRQLRAVRPTINISTDIIVGFPGETESDFEKTLSLVKEIGFDQSFSFIYSPRPGTPAANLPDDVPLDIKKHRLQILQDLLTQQAKTISDNMVGTLQTILVTNASLKDPSLLCGHTESNHLVRFKETNKDLIGQFVKIHITQALTNSLKGQRIN
ncbi:MAG TPA: radical SAM protein, partial [Gammaproteobacteria bacterium]|nr:radical SAM protein [Gammaproteobacteria bacterium]